CHVRAPAVTRTDGVRRRRGEMPRADLLARGHEPHEIATFLAVQPRRGLVHAGPERLPGEDSGALQPQFDRGELPCRGGQVLAQVPDGPVGDLAVERHCEVALLRRCPPQSRTATARKGRGVELGDRPDRQVEVCADLRRQVERDEEPHPSRMRVSPGAVHTVGAALARNPPHSAAAAASEIASTYSSRPQVMDSAVGGDMAATRSSPTMCATAPSWTAGIACAYDWSRKVSTSSWVEA